MPAKKLLGAAAMTAALAGGGIIGATVGSPTTSGAQDPTTSTTAPADPAPGSGAGERGEGLGRGGKGIDLDVAAETLGLTVDELRTELEAGKTLAQVAEAEGVERQVLVDALVAAGEARLDEARATLPERVAELADRTLPAGGRGGPGGGHGRGPHLEAAAEALGLTPEELRTRLQDGATLGAIADAEGVDRQVLVDALVAEATERLHAAVADGKLTQAEADERKAELAERLTERLDRAGPAGGRPGGPGGRGPGGRGPGGEAPPEDAPADGGN
ncbi:MAG TPA: hypothetical protein VHK88_04585 [Aquihabitans sp.]|nr:hypothetical protein [Aquihabitans sp.]